MALSMDLRLNPHLQVNPAAPFEARAGSGGMPPESPLDMPPQELRYQPPRRGRLWPDAAVLYARFILVTITFGVTIYGVYQMLQVVRFASMTLLQGLMIFFFAISLGWIAFAAGSVLAGASKRRDPTHPDSGRATRTALVMPVYNEDPLRTTAALQAMAEALALIDAHRGFEIVILSDSTNADSWIRETLRVDLLRSTLLPIMPVWYRRRWQNIARKSGNLEDFVTRWGSRYDHMIVLDADSLIDAPTLQRLVRAMQTDPHLGILQTAPQLIGATTFFGRLQQFAACVYGPVITRGLSAWSGNSSNYWGHNAIISYLSSPLWLVMLGIGFALAVQSHLIRPEYFSHDFQLFPTWPRFDVELMMALFWFSMIVLLIPKMLGLVRALSSRRIRRGSGGVIGVAASFLLEVILSALYAPVLMLIQSRHVFEVFVGRDSGWKPQRRDGGGTTWSDAWHYHKRHMFLSCATAVIVWFLSPPLLAWLSPALLGLFLSVPLSRASGSESLGRILSKVALLRTPEEAETPPLVARRRELMHAGVALPEDGLRYLARNRESRLTHINGNLARPADPRGHPDPYAFTAEQKLKDARSLDEALAWLTPIERVEVAGDARLLNQLALLPDAEYPLFLI